ncbi:MAG TPA: oxygenase MpaB family protein [Flavisolibacter sp.]|nr:oxygenase MpaB family protein [Flavisolibacter sp.]
MVRTIWGKSDTILFIFAGAAAEFALNKAVDWLYFTGRLPADPLGRLFSTVAYARVIVFAEKEKAWKAIDSMRLIHKEVEAKRGGTIPDWAYRDVLFMLIHYSIAAYELLERKLSMEEKEEVFRVFREVGDRMGLVNLPASYVQWLPVRQQHLDQDLAESTYTTDLFRQYKKHLGAFRYRVLVQGQTLVIPERVRLLLHRSAFSWLQPVIPFYKLSRLIHMDKLIKALLLPPAYQQQIRKLDIS